MGDIGIRILAGICGASLFALINQYVLTLSGATWLVAMAAIFAISFVAALVVQRKKKKAAAPPRRQTIGSENESGGKMKVGVEGTPPLAAGTSTIGSRNKSAGDMNVTVKADAKK